MATTANSSPKETRRQALGRVDAGAGADDNRQPPRQPALAREAAAENQRGSRGDPDPAVTDNAGDWGDAGENDSLGG